MIFLKKKNYIMGIIFIILGILIDQLVKVIIRVNISVGEHISVIKGFFNIAHVENTGAAWGGFSGFTVILIIVSIIILGYFIYLYKNIDFKRKIVFSISLVLVIGGTIGNLIDRLFFRSVTDFLDFNIFGYDFPVFNIADILLVVGFFLFLVDMIFISDNDTKAKDNKEEITETKEEFKEETIEENNDVEVSNNEMSDDCEGTDRDSSI